MKEKFISLILSIVFLFSLSTTVLGQPKNSPPKIHGTSAITVDVETGEIIYAKDIDGKNFKAKYNTKGMYPASITKLMTALVFSENNKNLQTLNYNSAGKNQPEYSLNINFLPIKIGEKITSQDIMDSLLLFSANDAAYVIAGNVGKDNNNDENSKEAIDNFIAKMNEKAKQLNMNNSHFVTANGLHDNDHYTTPYDLTLLGKAAFNNKWIRETMKKKEETITIAGKPIKLENRNKLVGSSVDGALCVGGKTGYTSKSGRCLLAIFEKDGRKMIGVVLNSIYDAKDSYVFEDMKKIISYSYNADKKNLYKKNSTIKTIPVSYKPLIFMGPEKQVNLPLTLKEDVNYYDNYVNKEEMKTNFNINNINALKLSSDTVVGKLSVSERGYNKPYNLYTTLTTKDVLKLNWPIYTGILVGLILIISLIVLLIKKLNRPRRRRY